MVFQCHPGSSVAGYWKSDQNKILLKRFNVINAYATKWLKSVVGKFSQPFAMFGRETGIPIHLISRINLLLKTVGVVRNHGARYRGSSPRRFCAKRLSTETIIPRPINRSHKVFEGHLVPRVAKPMCFRSKT